MHFNTKNMSGLRFERLLVTDQWKRTAKGVISWLCQCNCGKTKWIAGHSLRGGDSKSCGCLAKELSSARSWKGGFRRQDGYSAIYKPTHPNAGKNGYIFVHTLVMSEHLGRPLQKGESVHHKNGVRDDNRIENLELWSKAQPAGQRVEDKLDWALDVVKTAILARYR